MNHAKEADMGIYITLHKPSKGMIGDAKMAGSYYSPGWQQNYAKVQIVEIDNLLHGQKPLLPPPYKKRGKSTSFNL
jgi:hypothetical protein